MLILTYSINLKGDPTKEISLLKISSFVSDIFSQSIGFVGLFPLYAEILSADMTVGGEGLILGFGEPELADDGIRTAVKHLADRCGELLVAV